MPLLPGKNNIGANIATERSVGKPQKQAVAIALRVAGVPKRATGGHVKAPTIEIKTTGPGAATIRKKMERHALHELDLYGKPQKRANGGHVGPLRGDTPGRADSIPTTVPDGSHVLPADVVNFLGQNNSAAGLSLLEKKFPHKERRAEGGLVAPSVPHMTNVPGTPHMSPAPHLIGIPHPHLTGVPHLAGVPRMGALGSMPHITKPRFATGGEAQKPVPVKLSDGEFVLGPEWVKKIGHGDTERGHRAIDEWILRMRNESIKKLKSLPPPVGFKK